MVTFAGAVSMTSATVGLLMALLALGLSTAPGWRELRWFAVCAAFAGLFNLANIVVTIHVSDATVVTGSRLALTFGGLHGIAWYFYSAAQDRRALYRSDRIIIAIALVCSLLASVPGVVLTDHLVSRDVRWLRIHYRDAEPTAFGVVTAGYFAFGLTVLFARYLGRWRNGIAGARSHAIALLGLIVGALHDALAMSGMSRGPYLLDLSMFVLVVSVGASLVARFVESARILETQSSELAIAHDELIKRERLSALGELAAVVAHEVRNPLAVVFNAAAMLPKTDSSSQEHAQLIAIVQEEAGRMRDIVSALLEFARPREPAFAHASVDALVAGAIDAACRAADVNPAETALVAAGGMPHLWCDAQLVHQAVVNLVSNALSSPGRRGPVMVSIGSCTDSAGRPSVAIRVADDGEGVPDDVKDKIFTPFFSTRSTGSGLGLSVVQRCADVHAGAVTVESTPGGGATFALLLARDLDREPARP